jgi:hypothetical protein
MWQWYKSTPVADIAVNRHQSSISSLESYRTSKYPQLKLPPAGGSEPLAPGGPKFPHCRVTGLLTSLGGIDGV